MKRDWHHYNDHFDARVERDEPGEVPVVRYRLRPEALDRARHALRNHGGDASTALRADPSLSHLALWMVAGERTDEPSEDEPQAM